MYILSLLLLLLLFGMIEETSPSRSSDGTTRPGIHLIPPIITIRDATYEDLKHQIDLDSIIESIEGREDPRPYVILGWVIEVPQGLIALPHGKGAYLNSCERLAAMVTNINNTHLALGCDPNFLRTTSQTLYDDDSYDFRLVVKANLHCNCIPLAEE